MTRTPISCWLEIRQAATDITSWSLYLRMTPKYSLMNTNLLTLSACETGVLNTDRHGREIDAIAMDAHLKGAKAVISSLWPVNDGSTGPLMADFYRRWREGNGNITKSEALREAQLDLLTGKVRGDPNADQVGDFSHPFYWAPFVLNGNWQ